MQSGESTLSDGRGLRRSRRLRTFVACGLVVIAAAAAGIAWFVDTKDEACTLVGGWSAVDVRLSPRQQASPRAVACVEGVCTDLKRGNLGVPIRARDEGPNEVEVVVILDRRNAPAIIRSGRVRLKAFQPNGPDCPGKWWRASAVVDRDGVRQVS